MKKAELKKLLSSALEGVNKDIAGHASRGGMYARGLASEGYNGGYADALRDVQLALQGGRPARNNWWPEAQKDQT